MADPWKVSGLVPGSPQTIRDTWQILGGCQGLFLAVSDHQGHMADPWKVSGLVPDRLRPSGTHGRSLEGIRACSLSQTIRRNRNTWQILGRCQGLFLAVSDHQGHIADHWKVSGLVPDCPRIIRRNRNTWQTIGRYQGLSQTIRRNRDTWQILGGCQGWFLAVLRPSGTTGTHGKPLEGIRVGSWLSSDHQAQQEHMANHWRVSGLVPGCPQTIGRYQGLFLTVSDHQGHMADHWKVSGLVPGSLRPSDATGTHGRPLEGIRVGSWQSQAIRRNRNTWQTIGGCQGWFLAVSDYQGHMADHWKVSGLVPGSPQTIRNTWQTIGGCQGLFLAVPGSSGTTGTHGRPLEGVRACSWLSPDHQAQQEHMADPWWVSELVPACPQTIRRNRNTWPNVKISLKVLCNGFVLLWPTPTPPNS